MKLPSFGKGSSNSQPQVQPAAQPSTMVLQEGRVVAEPLKLTLVLPNQQRMEVEVDPFSTFAHLKQIVATALGVSSFDLYQRAKRIGLERVDLDDDERLVGRLRPNESLHVKMGKKSQQLASVSTSHPQVEQAAYTQAMFYGQQEAPMTQRDFQQVHDETLDDEEFAIKLQTEECGLHHANLMLEKHSLKAPSEALLSAPESEKKLPPSPKSTMVVPDESMESFGGRVVLRGTRSQYDVDGGWGESACTSICLLASSNLLLIDPKGEQNPVGTLTADLLDAMVNLGVRKHCMAVSGHSCVEDLWTLPSFADDVASLKRGTPITDQVGFDGFYKALDTAWAYATSVRQVPGRGPRVAVILTKSPETVLCFACKYDEWHFFDSHGAQNASKKEVYLMRFTSTTAMAFALQHKFPSLADVDDKDNWQTQMYNSFEATPIVAGIDESEACLKTEISTGTPEHCQLPPFQVPYDADMNMTDTPRTPDFDVARPVQASPPVPPLATKVDKDVFLDPLLFTLMADPVVCDDGHTYDRATVETHFQTRREAEHARQEGTGQADAQTNCCGSVRHEIELTSPLNGEVLMTDRLVPNRKVEEQIVALVEANRLELSEEELTDWNERREEKRVKDRARAEEYRKLRERQAEMRRNREEAQRRRAAEAEAVEDGIAVSSNERPSQLVRVVQYSGGERPREELSIAVSLCEKSSWVPVEYASGADTALRCMVACCGRQLRPDSPSWCERCGRLACSSCLSFQVSNYVELESSELHRICFECLVQIVEVMPRSGALGQTRAYLTKLRLAPYMNTLSQRAIAAQDASARDAAEKEFGPRIRQLEDDINELRNSRTDLQVQIREAEQRAEQARTDDGVSAVPIPNPTNARESNILEWEETCADLSAQYEALLKKNARDGDEDAQLTHFQAISDITHRLESAQVSLMEARSRAAAEETRVEPETPATSRTGSNAADTAVSSSNASMSVAQLQEVCTTLQMQHQTLSSQKPPDDEEAQMAHFIAISDIESRFETAQLDLATARARLGAAAGSPSRHYEYGELSNQINAFVVHVTSAAHTNPSPVKRSLFRRKKNSSDSQGVSDSIRSRLLDALQHARICSRTDSLEERHARIGSLNQVLKGLRPDMQRMQNRGIQTRYDNILQEVTAMRKEVAMDQPQMTPASRQMNIKPVSNMSIDELQTELIALSTRVDTLGGDIDEITDTMMRISEIEQRLQAAEPAFLASQDPPQVSSESTSTNVSTEIDTDHDPSLLDAIAKVDEDWPLPLGLEYPTARMTRELEILVNKLEQNLPRSQQKYDDEYLNRRQELTEQQSHLEDEVARLRSQVQSAEASADEENKRLEARRELRHQEEMERREREQARLERERRAREAEEELRRKHAQDEEATCQALANAVGREGNAAAFGGRGDLRMCRMCKAGPVENQACSDLGAHNDGQANHCLHCEWFSRNWHDWLKWDGITGPH